MATHPFPFRSRASRLARWLLVGFIASAVSVLVFHQGALAMLHSLGLTQSAAYSLKAVAPWGVPQVRSLAGWGGVWGVLLAAALHRRDGPALRAAPLIFGVLGPTLVAVFHLS